MGTYVKGIKRNKNEKLSKLTISFHCQVKVTDIAAHNDQVPAKSFVAVLRDEIFNYPAEKKLSAVTIHDCVTPPGTSCINFHNTHVIYLITCDKLSVIICRRNKNAQQLAINVNAEFFSSFRKK